MKFKTSCMTCNSQEVVCKIVSWYQPDQYDYVYEYILWCNNCGVFAKVGEEDCLKYEEILD